MKHLFFKSCPKSGRVVALRWRHDAPRVLFPVFALLCVGWFLLRVVPCPSRLAHPCQRIAAPVALQALAWLAGVLGLAALARKLRPTASPHPPAHL